MASPIQLVIVIVIVIVIVYKNENCLNDNALFPGPAQLCLTNDNDWYEQ